ncbi:CvpA family protein [Oleispirillum naphthae]|uniref:CvpA family protein n=1 Tax=Oleispirillum naphthae TaxID=2838853 RepID=UPI00308266C4
MSNLPLPMVDLVVFAVVILSALFATLRGFTHEVFSIAGWLAAVLAVVFGLPVVRPYARAMVENRMIADAGASVVLFLATLFLAAMVTRTLSRGVKGSALSPVDRALGFVFGAVRGALLIVLAYLAMIWLLDLSAPPTWMRGAKTTPWIVTGADALKGIAPASLFETEIGRAATRTKNTAQDAMAVERTLKSWSAPAPKQPESTSSSSGYADDQRREMNRLIDANR